MIRANPCPEFLIIVPPFGFGIDRFPGIVWPSWTPPMYDELVIAGYNIFIFELLIISSLICPRLLAFEFIILFRFSVRCIIIL